MHKKQNLCMENMPNRFGSFAQKAVLGFFGFLTQKIIP